jgi:hypothetical protein
MLDLQLLSDFPPSFFYMFYTLLLFCTLGPIAILASKFGPAYRITQTNAYIIEAETTLFPPNIPSPQQDALLIWAGLDSDTKDRFQGVLASYETKKK